MGVSLLGVPRISWTSKSDGKISPRLGGGFKYVLFSPLLGKMNPFLTSIFFRWVVQPPTRRCSGT